MIRVRCSDLWQAVLLWQRFEPPGSGRVEELHPRDQGRGPASARGIEGPQQLSLRAVARDLGMASSALYRYFPSRDDLLTALIVDAYSDLAAAVDRAVVAASTAAAPPVPAGTAGAARVAAGRAARARWRALSSAVRDWAREHPHEYALIYGTPVPGYHAPPETIALAGRVPLAFVGLLLRPSPAAAGAAGRPSRRRRSRAAGRSRSRARRRARRTPDCRDRQARSGPAAAPGSCRRSAGRCRPAAVPPDVLSAGA